ncbi:MAG: hypothetical protein V4598_15245 [Bdellovibrionota bacterium]
MKLFVLTILFSMSFSSFAFTPENVQCLKDAKKSGIKMEQAYQLCSTEDGSKSLKKRK